MNLEELEQAYAELGQKIKNLKQKPKRFPQEGEMYWYYDHLFKVHTALAYENLPRRVFKTEEEAKQAARIEKAKIELKYIIQELNDGWVPDFNTTNNKYTVCIYNGGFKVASVCSVRYRPSWMYLKSSELAERLIKDHSELLELVLSE